MSKNCPKCGKNITFDGALFCPECGHKFTGKAVVDMDFDWIDNILLRKQTKKFVPVFKYRLRLIKNPSVRDDLDGKIIGYMPWIRIPVSWVSLRTR